MTIVISFLRGIIPAAKVLDPLKLGQVINRGWHGLPTQHVAATEPQRRDHALRVTAVWTTRIHTERTCIP